MSIKDGMAGITIPGDWIEAYVDITFSLNPQYYFTFHLIRDNLLSTNKKYLQDYYSSENDRHNICLVASATGVKLESYTYCGQDIGQNCEMNLFLQKSMKNSQRLSNFALHITWEMLKEI